MKILILGGGNMGLTYGIKAGAEAALDRARALGK